MDGAGSGQEGMERRRTYRFRRNLLFVTTLVTLVLVYLGAVPFHERLSASVARFTVFWAGVFVLAAFVLAMAVYDLARVRRDHRLRVRELEKELAATAAEARDLARRMQFGEGDGDDA